MKRRVIVSAAVLVGLFAVAVLFRPSLGRANTENGMAGSGFGADPYQITNCTDLQNVSLNLESHYILANNIDCSATASWNSGAGFIPIGLGSMFTGSLDGRGRSITGLHINTDVSLGSGYLGLFPNLNGKLGNFSLSNAVITTSGQKDGQLYIGSVVGELSINGIISHVSFDGAITVGCASTQALFVGGLAGWVQGGASILEGSSVGTINASNCPTTPTILGGLAAMNHGLIQDSNSSVSIAADASRESTSSGYVAVGGLIGAMYSGNVATSYAAGLISVSGDTGGPLLYRVGGVVGDVAYQPVTLSDSFTASSITLPGPCDTMVCGSDAFRSAGAIIGHSDISQDYSTSYYDQLVVGVATCDSFDHSGCVAVNTAGSPAANYFKNNSANAPLNNWDFSSVWQTTAQLPTHRAATPNPGAPTNLQATINSVSAIDLSWDAPGDTGGSPLINYNVVYRKVGDTNWQGMDTESSGTSATLTGLAYGAQYEIKIAAQNQDGYWSVAPEQVIGTTATPGFYLVTNCQQLQDIQDDLTGNYELANNIDCSDTVNWNGGAGFDPIGYFPNQAYFSGLFQGNNYSISDLYINQSGGQYAFVGLFEGAYNAAFQDIRIVRPVISASASDVVYGATLVVLNLGLENNPQISITNVHVVDAQVTLEASGVVVDRAEGQLAGGLVAYSAVGSEASYSRNEFRGTIRVGGDVSSSYVGGLYGLMAGSTVIDDSFARADVEVESTLTGVSEEVHAIGGLVGLMLNEDGTLLINHSYASGSISLTTAEPTGAALIGGLGGAIGRSTISNSFARVAITNSTPAVQQATGGLLGGWMDNQTSSSSNSFFDADVAGTGDCMSPLLGVLGGCNAISGQPNYFYNNSTNPPLNSWDFTNIWNTTSTLPVFDKKVLTSITAIPASRLPGYVPPAGTVFPQASGAPAVGPVVPPKLSLRTFGEKFLPPAENTPASLIERLRRFFKNVPEVVLVAFPYAFFSLLLIGALALLVEVWLQAKRLRATKLLIARQEAVAKERDTFWHLAANYLRAPITLMVGGVELLSDDKFPGVAKLQLLSTNLQAKVGTIMERIEDSKSLQDITRPKAEAPKRVLSLVRFWAPVVAVGMLAVAMNVVATSYRNINLSLISLGMQVMIFVIASLLLYWVLGALGVVKSKRKQAEALLKRQAASLDGARSEFIAQSANDLDKDLAQLQHELDGMHAKAATGKAAAGTATAMAIVSEGAHRLRDLIDSFELLVAAQNNKLGELSPQNARTDLHSIVGGALVPLQPVITEKHLAVHTGTMSNMVVPGNSLLLNQVVGSVLANAVAFSPAGSTIELSLKQAKGSVQLVVTNQGTPISKDEISHVFSPLTKADGYDGLQLDHDGLGVNLYIDKLIMQHLGGGIHVASSTTKGTTMTMQWPTASGRVG